MTRSSSASPDTESLPRVQFGLQESPCANYCAPKRILHLKAMEKNSNAHNSCTPKENLACEGFKDQSVCRYSSSNQQVTC
jgi:hypothetical protein